MRRLRNARIYLRVAGLLLVLYLAAAFSLYSLERGVNPKCETLYDAFWLTTVFFFSGFEEFGPVTTGGRLISLISFILGAGVMVAVTAKSASLLVAKDRRKIPMPEQSQGQIVICNWNDRGDRIIKELHASQAAPDTEIVVITPKQVNEAELRKSPTYEKVFFIRSDPTLHDVLRASRVHLARSVILLANEDSPEPDAESALIALAITRLCDGGRKPHIVVEAKNHRKMQHLKDAGADEVVCATDYGLGILAQSALNEKLSDVYHNLLAYSKDTNEIYIVEGSRFPKAVVGMSFQEAASYIQQHRDGNNPSILIGVKRNGRTILNPVDNWDGPAEDRFERFQEGDALVVLAYGPPDFSHLNGTESHRHLEEPRRVGQTQRT